MSFITAVPSSTRATQSMVAVGTLIAAAVSVYIIHKTHERKRPSQSDNDDGSLQNADAESSDFYKKLGISEEDLPQHIQREIYKERKRQEKVESLARKTPMYDNVLMHNKHGNPMCCVSMKKARWYVKKGIAEWSSLEDIEGRGQPSENNNNEESDDVDDAATKCIRLLFEHNRAEPESYEETSDTHFATYLRTVKKNVCVSCGDDKHHMRHYILPKAYRNLLPEEYTKHMSHDVVILCPECHVSCERHAKGRMKELEDELRTKLYGEGSIGVPSMIDDPHLGHIKSCAIAIVKWKDNIPVEKLKSHEREVRAYLASVCDEEEEKEAIINGTEELSKAQLQTACSVKFRVKNPDFVPGPVIVVESLKSEEDIDKFITDWRKHFIDTTNPKFMPTGWRVENPVICRLGTDAGV